MSSKRTFVSAFSLATLLAMPVWGAPQAADASAQSQAAPRLTLVEPLKDFGTVPKGTMLDWSFTIRNTGNADLQILSAQPTCGCTVAEFDRVIKPGDEGRVVAHVDTTQFTGPIQKAVDLRTNDPAAPTAQLTINANVKPYVQLHPSGFVRFSMLQGESQTQTVRIYSEEDTPFEIVSVQSPVDWIQADVVELTGENRMPLGRDGQKQYAINITVDERAQMGPLAQKVEIQTTSKYQPFLQVSVSGVVRPGFAVNPTIVNFGETAPGAPEASRTVVLQTNDRNNPAAFQVTRVESASDAVKASVKPTDMPGQYEVTVSLAPGAAGALDSNVKIYTNSKANPIVTVPVRGHVVSGR